MVHENRDDLAKAHGRRRMTASSRTAHLKRQGIKLNSLGVDGCFKGHAELLVLSMACMGVENSHKLGFAGTAAWVSRTGYTGEDGFELVVPNEHAVALWDQLLSLGQAPGLVPAGLGARAGLPHPVH